MTTFIEFREATLEDVDDIVEMSEGFWQDSPFCEHEFMPEHVNDMVIQCLQHGVCSVLVIDDVVRGFLAGLIGPLLANDQVLIGTEVGFFVHPEFRNTGNGAGLVLHAEKTAREKGAMYWSMLYMHTSMPEQVARLYESLEYKQAETSYVKRL